MSTTKFICGGGETTVPRVKSEYEVEDLYIDRLTGLGYEYVELKNYDDVRANFREQFCKLSIPLAPMHKHRGGFSTIFVEGYE